MKMFVRINTALIAIVFSFSCSSQPVTNFELSGVIQGVNKGKAYIYKTLSNSVDSVDVKNQIFNFKQKLDKFDYITLVVKDETGKTNASMFQMVIEPNTKLKFEGEQTNPTGWSFKGTPEATLTQKWRKLIQSNEANYIKTLMKSQTPEGKYDVPPNQVAYLTELLQANNKLLYKFIDENPSTFSSVSAILYSLTITPAPIDPNNKKELAKRLKSAWNTQISNSGLGQGLTQALLATIPQIGELAPDFTQNDVNGNPISLSSYKGKYVLIDFWASWCLPCRRENPNVVRAYNKYKAKNFEMLGVSLDNSKANWLKAIQVDNLQWAHVSDLKGFENEVALKYNVRAIPANYLIDPEGNIIEINLRGEGLLAYLDNLLGDK